MAGKTKKIGLLIVILALIAVAVGYFLWNKPHTSVSSSIGIKITADELYQVFVTDSAIANTKYVDKIVEVTGTVKSTSVNQQQQTTIALQTKADGAAVNCTVEQKDAVVKEGSVVKIKGICTGLGEGDADLGLMGDVYLIRCYIAE